MKTGILRDHMGKLSITRVMAWIAFLNAIVIAYFSIAVAAITGNADIIKENISLVVALLTFAGTIKVGGAGAEAIAKRNTLNKGVQ